MLEYTIITIVKWVLYQNCDYGDNQQNSQHINQETINCQPPRQPDNNHKQETKEVNKEKKIRSEEIPIGEVQPPSSIQSVDFKDIRSSYIFDTELNNAVNNWLMYKDEKKQSYKPSGLNSLLSQVQKQAHTYGYSAVVHAINESMASNYQGIVWDKAKTFTSQRDLPKQNGNPFLNYARQLENEENNN